MMISVTLLLLLLTGFRQEERMQSLFSEAGNMRFTESASTFRSVDIVPEISQYSRDQLKNPTQRDNNIDFINNVPFSTPKHMILAQQSTEVGVQMKDLKTEQDLNFQNPVFIHKTQPAPPEEKFIKNTTIL